jgi:hypothetical protein
VEGIVHPSNVPVVCASETYPARRNAQRQGGGGGGGIVGTEMKSTAVWV